MNAATHRLGAALTIGGFSAYKEYLESGEISAKPLAHAGVAAACGTLPDLLEPAHHPNHRQFLHSLTFAFGLGMGLYHVHKWQPEEPWQKHLRTLTLIAGGAYLVHLAMDATTPKSLPLI